MNRTTSDVLLAVFVFFGGLATNAWAAAPAVSRNDAERPKDTLRLAGVHAPTPAEAPTPSQPPAPAPAPAPSDVDPFAAPLPLGAEPPPHTERPLPPIGQVAQNDLDLLRTLHQSHQAEIDVAKLATGQAESSRVRSFAQTIEQEHAAADRALLAYAERKRIDRSKLEPTVTGADESEEDSSSPRARLEGATGKDFDREFVTLVKVEHDKAIQMVRDGIGATTDDEIRTLLTALLPKLERHRKMAQDLLDKHFKG